LMRRRIYQLPAAFRLRDLALPASRPMCLGWSAECVPSSRRSGPSLSLGQGLPLTVVVNQQSKAIHFFDCICLEPMSKDGLEKPAQRALEIEHLAMSHKRPVCRHLTVECSFKVEEPAGWTSDRRSEGQARLRPGKWICTRRAGQTPNAPREADRAGIASSDHCANPTDLSISLPVPIKVENELEDFVGRGRHGCSGLAHDHLSNLANRSRSVARVIRQPQVRRTRAGHPRKVPPKNLPAWSHPCHPSRGLGHLERRRGLLAPGCGRHHPASWCSGRIGVRRPNSASWARPGDIPPPTRYRFSPASPGWP
jgi:hypothetical protein